MHRSFNCGVVESQRICAICALLCNCTFRSFPQSCRKQLCQTDNTVVDSFVCVCGGEQTVETTHNEGLGSLRGKQERDSILTVNKSTMFHFSPITVDKEGETCRQGGNQRACLCKRVT